MKIIKSIFSKYNSLANFKYRLYFYTGLIIFVLDKSIYKHSWFSNIYELLILPISLYVVGVVVISIAWKLADYKGELDNLIEKEASVISDNRNR